MSIGLRKSYLTGLSSGRHFDRKAGSLPRSAVTRTRATSYIGTKLFTLSIDLDPSICLPTRD